MSSNGKGTAAGTSLSKKRITRQTDVSGNGFDPLTDLYAEWDEQETIDAIEVALSELGDVVRLEANKDFPTALEAARPDLVFNVAEAFGGVTRESFVPTFCEFWGIPYTGSDPLTLATCLDKARAKEVLAFQGIPTPEFIVARLPGDLRAWSRYPCVVKPLHEGSSKGITSSSFCRTQPEAIAEVEQILDRYGEPAIVERFLPGREFTVAILGDGPAARVLPIVEIDFSTIPSGAPPIYGFEAKWIWDRPENPLEIFRCPANCEAALAQRINEICLEAFRVLGCRDWARIDVRCDAEGSPHIIEVNPLPGIIPDPDANSCYPKAARAAGLSYSNVIHTVLRSAAERHGFVLAARD